MNNTVCHYCGDVLSSNKSKIRKQDVIEALKYAHGLEARNELIRVIESDATLRVHLLTTMLVGQWRRSLSGYIRAMPNTMFKALPFHKSPKLHHAFLHRKKHALWNLRESLRYKDTPKSLRTRAPLYQNIHKDPLALSLTIRQVQVFHTLQDLLRCDENVTHIIIEYLNMMKPKDISELRFFD